MEIVGLRGQQVSALVSNVLGIYTGSGQNVLWLEPQLLNVRGAGKYKTQGPATWHSHAEHSVH